MANREYTKYKNRKLGSGTQSLIDWDTDTIKAILVTSGYSPDTSESGDEFLSDISGADIVATEAVTGITIAAGAVLPSGSVTFPAVTGSVATQVVLYKDTGSGATSPLAILYDTFTSGMPVTPDGNDIVLTFNVAGIMQT